jgi:cytoskeletal protein CcmA (bactofilin family)
MTSIFGDIIKSEQITIHTMATSIGTSIKYARVLRKNGNTIKGQSVSLHRLSPEQCRRALDASHNDHKKYSL